MATDDKSGMTLRLDDDDRTHITRVQAITHEATSSGAIRAALRRFPSRICPGRTAGVRPGGDPDRPGPVAAGLGRGRAGPGQPGRTAQGTGRLARIPHRQRKQWGRGRPGHRFLRGFRESIQRRRMNDSP